MTLTDLRTTTHPQTLRYTSRFGLNRSQGTYFYQIVQKSPPGTYLADLKHVSQPTSLSLLGRLLREASGTLPQLVPHEPVRNNTQSRRAWYNFEMKYGPSRKAEPPREAPVPPTTSDQKAVDGPVQPPAKSPASNDPPPKEDPTPTSIIAPIWESPPPVTQPDFSTLPAQLIPLSIPIPETPLIRNVSNFVDTYRYPYPYGITNTSPIDGGNLPPQYLPHYSTGTLESIPQDDMDCSSPSPMLLSDVDMDILTDTVPAPPSYDYVPWTQWGAIPEYAPVAPPHHSTFVPPQPISVWQTLVQEPPPFANQHSCGFAAPAPLYASSFHADIHMQWDASMNDLPGHNFVPATPEPRADFSNLGLLLPPESTYHPFPLNPINAASDRIQDTVETHWPEPRHHPVSVATLVDEFERSLTLVAEEPPSFKADNRSDHNRPFEPSPACIIEDESRVSLEPITIHASRMNTSDVPFATSGCSRSSERPDHSPSFKREATEPLGEDDQTPAYFPNLHDSSPFERKSTEPLEDSGDQFPSDLPPSPFEREATEPLEESEDQPPACFLDLDVVSLPTGTVPEPPVSHPAPPVVRLLARLRPPTPPPSRRATKPAPSDKPSMNKRTTRQSAARLLTKKDLSQLAQASVQASKRAQLKAQLGGARGRTPVAVRCSRRKREGGDEEDEEDPRPDRRDRKKRTRFVLPDREGRRQEGDLVSLLPRPRRACTGKATDAAASGSTGRTTGPPRSILRKAMPYQKVPVRHAGQRAHVP